MTATTYNFDIGISDASIELSTIHNNAIFSKVIAVKPAFWRIIVPWYIVSTVVTPGPYQDGGAANINAAITGSGFVGQPNTNGSLNVQANATGAGIVGGAPGSQTGRNWALVDAVINDIRLKVGCDVVLIIGQDKPSGWTYPQFQSFCAEVATRYKPNGPGIRTDGQYSVNAGWGVTYFEIWNEQNNQQFNNAPVDPGNYTKLLIAGNAGVKSVLPGAASTVIFGGTQHVQFTGPWFNPFLGGGYGYVATDEFTFVQQCYAAAIAQGTTLGANFDAMACHIYPFTDQAISGSTAQGAVIPGAVTSGGLKVSALATGSGQVNLTPARNGTLQCVAAITGTGVLNAFQPAGPVPDIRMDNFRQIISIHSLMVANGDSAKKMHITEIGYCVYSTGMTPALQKTYLQSCFDILNTLSYIGMVLIYNSADPTNGTTDDGYTGYGIVDYYENARPIYDWLRSISTIPLTRTGALTVSALAQGAGVVASPGTGALSVNALATGAGAVSGGGGVIKATITGAGVLGNFNACVINANIRGTGSVGIVPPTISGKGALVAFAIAMGTGRVSINASSNGDLLVAATAFGSGQVASVNNGNPTVFANIIGAGTLTLTPGTEIGVVGEVTGGVLAVTASILGAGGLTLPPDAGILNVAASIVGAGTVIATGSGSLNVTANATGSGVNGPASSGTLTATATITGAGVVGVSGAGSLTVTETASGSAGSSNSGSLALTATASGTGVTGKQTGGALSVTATAAGNGVEGEVTSGGQTITATISGAGVVGVMGAGTLGITATAVGGVGYLNTGSLTVTETASGTGTVAISNSGSLSVTAAAAGVGAVGKSTGGSLTVTETGTGAGVAGEVTGGSLTATATISGAGVIGTVAGGSLTVTETASGSSGTNNAGSPLSISATAAGAGATGEMTGGSLTATATATAAGVVGEVTGGVANISATITGAGVVGEATGGALTVTATATGAGTAAAANNFWLSSAQQISGTGNGFLSIVHSVTQAVSSSEGYVQIPLSDACTVTAITFYVTNAPGAGNSWSLTMRKNAADTAAVATISGTNTSATWTGSLSLAQLDLISMKTTGTGSPAASGNIYYTITYSCSGGVYMLPACNPASAQISSTNEYLTPFGTNASIPTTTATDLEVLIPTSLSVTKIAALNTVNGGAGGTTGNTDTFTVVNNSTSTTSAFSAAITSGVAKAVSGSGSALSFSAGDLMVIKDAKGSAWLNMATCLTINPGTAGEQVQVFGSINQPSTSATVYEQPQGSGLNGWNSTEATAQMRCPACTIKSLYVKLNTAPGTSKSRQFDVRKNGANSGVTGTISGASTTVNDTTHTSTVSAGDTIDVMTTPTSTPAATAGVKLGFVLVPS